MNGHRGRKKTRPDIRFISLEPQQLESGPSVQDFASQNNNSSSNNKSFSNPQFEQELKKIKKNLDRIPSAYHNAISFNKWEQVLEILKSENLAESKKRLEIFCESMNSAMEVIVENLYEGFNRAIQNYTKILQNMRNAEQRVDLLNEDFEKAHSTFSSRSQFIDSNYMQRLEFEYAILILDKIKELCEVPERLQKYIQNKEFLKASILLVESETLLYQDSLRNINALVTLRDDLIVKRSLFHETIIEELQNLIYKSAFRFRDENEGPLQQDKSVSEFAKLHGDTKRPTIEELTSHEFVELAIQLVNSLFVLNRVKIGVDTLVERAQIEWRNLVRNIISKAQKEINTMESSRKSFPPPPPPPLPPSQQHLGSAHSNKKFVPLLQQILDVTKKILNNHKIVCDLFHKKLEDAPNEMPPQSLFHFQHQRKRIGITLIEEPTLIPIHSPLTSELIAIIKRTYTLDTIWSLISQELQLLIGYYIGIGTLSNCEDINKRSHTLQETSSQKLFRFSASSAFTFGENLDSGYVVPYDDEKLFLGDTLSPYNLTHIYPLIISFHKDIKSLLTSKKENFREWLDDFVQHTFLQQIRVDYKKRAIVATETPDAFKPIPNQTLQRLGNEDPLNHSVVFSAVEIFSCVEELYHNIISMPRYAHEFMTLLENVILHKYFDTCNSKFEEIIRDSEVSKMITTPKILQLLLEDPEWKRLQRLVTEKRNVHSRRSGELNAQWFDAIEEERPKWTYEHRDFDLQLFGSVEQQLFNRIGTSTNVQPKKRSILDSSHIGVLAAMHISLLWFIDKIEHLEKRNSTSTIYGSHSSEEKRTVQEEKNSINKVTSEKIPNLTKKLSKLLNSFRSLSDKCLLTLKLEYRIRCYFFLDSVRHCSYQLDTEQKKPDPFILELNQDLAIGFETLVNFLPYTKLHYVFGRLPHLMCHILIQSLSKIKSINRFGALKMCRNVLTLQQNLSNLFVCDEEPFERVRKFYELLTGSVEDVFQHIDNNLSNHTKLFSLEEYQKLLEFLSPNRSVSNELLQRLKEHLKQAYLSI